MTDMTVEEARQWLRDRIDDGAHCPVCEQLAKVYRRRINAGAARGLIEMLRDHGQEWVHVPTTGHLSRLGGEFARLRYWGLVIEEPELREDGGRSGWWRVTNRGREFVHNRVMVPKYARVYDGRVLNHDQTEYVNIIDALGHKFDYRELMDGPGSERVS